RHDRGYVYRLLGFEVLLQLLAACDGHPSRKHGRQRCDRRGPFVGASGNDTQSPGISLRTRVFYGCDGELDRSLLRNQETHDPLDVVLSPRTPGGVGWRHPHVHKDTGHAEGSHRRPDLRWDALSHLGRAWNRALAQGGSVGGEALFPSGGLTA